MEKEYRICNNMFNGLGVRACNRKGSFENLCSAQSAKKFEIYI